MQDAPELPRKILLLTALLQGLVLLLLHESIEFKFWPHNQPQWLFAFYSMAFVGPLMLLLSFEDDNWRALLRWVLPFTALCGFLGFYVGWQATPIAHVRMENLLFGFIATLTVATFKTLIYAQQHATGEPFTYRHLFRFSWRNFLTLALSLIFMLSVWGVLMLWAALFKVINIHFFYDLFTQRWFYYPALALAHGFGVIIFRNQSKVIDTITRIQQALMKFLLIILILVSLLFLAALPFTGLAPLWQTGNGSALILWLQALMLFFLNAVYQDDADARPYPLLVHRFIYIGVALLPVYSVIAFYGLGLRIDQYGWTVERCWGFLLASLLALFSLGYLWGIIKQQDNWLERLSWVNVRMGLAVLATMILINTPVADFRKISVNSQMDRLSSGKVSYLEFDYTYFRRELAQPGYNALQKIKTDVAATHPEIAIKIDNLYGNYGDQNVGVTREIFFKALRLPDGETIPESLADAIFSWAIADNWRTQNVQRYQLLRADLNGDNQQDYVLLQVRDHYPSGTLFSLENGVWKNWSMSYRSARNKRHTGEVIKSLEEMDVEVIAHQWQLLKLGDLMFQVENEQPNE
jgi:hypothetical protein